MKTVEYERMLDFCKDVLLKVGVDTYSATAVSEGLCETSLRGIDSHGIRLLPHYVANVEGGGINRKPSLEVTKTFPSYLVINGDDGFGHAAGMKAVEEGCKVACEMGMCCVAVKNSTHPGAMASFTVRAAEKGCIAFAFTNTGPKMLSHNGKRSYFGTNPIACAAPRGQDEPPYSLDMATTMIPWNKVEHNRRTGEPMPDNTTADMEGHPTTNPADVASLLGIGGHKGFGLASMVEMLTTVNLGMKFGHHTIPMYGQGSGMDKKRGIGQFYMFVRADGCVTKDEFESGLSEMSQEVRQEPSRTSTEPVMVPGDPEIEMAKHRRQHGIPIDSVVEEGLLTLSNEYGVDSPFQ